MVFKIVVVGDVRGQFVDVLKKISALHAKNNFSLALIAGDLFADPQASTEEDEENLKSLLQNKIQVPVTTYFALGKSPLPAQVIERLQATGGELCDNFFFLGKRSTIKTSDGIRLAALGGCLDAQLTVDSSKDEFTPFYSLGDVQSLSKTAQNVDILLTSEWPLNISRGSKLDQGIVNGATPPSQQCVADLCSSVKPRYFFSTSDSFFEREPFFHAPTESASDGYFVTRFLSLASYNNPNKQKWVYAFSLDPAATTPQVVPTGTTASPLAMVPKKRKEPLGDQNTAFSYYDKRQNRGKKRQRQPPPGPSECFFCLSNPNLATHLVTSIGDDAYLTTAKGPLTTSESFSELKFPAHMLIIPLPHNGTLASIADAESRKNTINEMVRYRDSLNRMVDETSEGSLGSVTWEVSRAEGIHTHWQYLPMLAKKIEDGLVEAAFKVEAENEKYPTFHVERLADDDAGASDYFKVWIWRPRGKNDEVIEDSDGNQAQQNIGKTTTMELSLDQSFRFDLQFGRRVMAKLLGLESRLNWRDCSQSEQEETKDAEDFKKAFKNYDFTLEA